MAAREKLKPPGCIYPRKKRYWWRGRLPNETAIRARKITPSGSGKALLATADNLPLAWEIVWTWWERSAAEVEGRATLSLTVAELAARYLAHAETYYRRKDGTPTGEADNVRYALRPLTSRFGNLSADSIDVAHVDQIQAAMIADGHGLSRSTINKRISTIKRMYRWAAGPKKLVPASSWHAVAVTENLKRGRSKARETEKVLPAEEASVDLAMEFMPVTLWRMVALHRLAGFRSTELCILRPMDVDRSDGACWVYTPAWHKEEHMDQPRAIPLGPIVQELLAPLLARPRDQYCFRPADAMEDQRSARRSGRKTPVQPSQIARGREGAGRRFRPRYDRRTYYRAVQYACDRAQAHTDRLAASVGHNEASGREPGRFQRWHPHQLRHGFLSKVKRLFDSDHARASGGHASIDATEIYLERDLKAARRVATAIG